MVWWGSPRYTNSSIVRSGAFQRPVRHETAGQLVQHAIEQHHAALRR
jgi:hypothetical protein